MSLRVDRFARATDFGGAVHVQCRCGVSLRLGLHFDAKTAPAVNVERSGRAVASVANAWPLPAGPLESGGSCSGATSACRDCYGAGIEARSPQYARLVSANLANLQHLYECGGRRAVVGALVEVVRHSESQQRALGVASPVFRWHSDGDIFAEWYARAIRQVVEQTDSVDHWIYTRTLGAVRHLVGARNFRVFVSADRFNVVQASRVAGRYGVGLAMLATDRADSVALWARALAVAPSVGGSGAVVCPASKWAGDSVNAPAHVVGSDGRRVSARRGAPAVGACVACGLCLPDGAQHGITFLVHGGQARGESAGRLGGAVALRVRRGLVTL